MTTESQFPHFPFLPFEIRELIWEFAALQPVGGNPPFQHTSQTGTVLAQGDWVIYRESGQRPPALAQACRQARAVALKEETCGRQSWEVRIDMLLLRSISPRILLGKAARELARSAPAVVIHIASFLNSKTGSSIGGHPALFLFELMRYVTRLAPYGTKIVVQELTGSLRREIKESAGNLFGEKVRGNSYCTQLVGLGNKTLVSRLMRSLSLQPPLSSPYPWPSWDNYGLDSSGSGFSEERLVDLSMNSIRVLEDIWLDCQYSAFYPNDAGLRKDIVGGTKGQRYNRYHTWVVETLAKMPRYEAMVMFNVSD